MNKESEMKSFEEKGFLEISNLHKSYGEGESRQEVLKKRYK